MAYMQGDRKMRCFENDLKTERFVLGKEGRVVRVVPGRENPLDRLMALCPAFFQPAAAKMKIWQ